MKKLLSVLLVMAILLTCIPLGAIRVFAEETEVQNSATNTDEVYYTDLFYAYPYYLAADAGLAGYSMSIENVYNSVYDSYANSPLVIGTGLENALSTITSPTAIRKLLTDAMGVTDFSYNQALDAANEEFLKNLLSNSSVLSAGETFAVSAKYCNKINKAISIFNGLELEDEYGSSLTVEGYVEAAVDLLGKKGALNHLSVNTVLSLWDVVYDNDFSLGDCFKLAKTEFEIAEAIVYCVILEDIRLGVVNDILSTQTKGTVLYDGMTRLKSQMNSNFAVRFCNQFLKSFVADSIYGAVDSAVGLFLDTAQLNAVLKLVNVAFNAALDVPEFAEILKWQVLMCYSQELAAGIPKYALKYAEAPFLSDKIGNYEALFSAYDAINNAMLDVAKKIKAMQDPIGEAYLVFVEAAKNGEETVTIKSGSLSVSVSATLSSNEFYDMMRLGVLMDYSGVTHNLGSSISVSNKNTTIKIPRKANTLFSIFREGVDEQFFLIESFKNSDAYSSHIASVKGTVQSIPTEERLTVPKDVYSKWTYTVDDSVQLLHGSDTVVSNSIYAVAGLLRGNITATGNLNAPDEEVLVDGDFVVNNKVITLSGKVTFLGSTNISGQRGGLIIDGELQTSTVSRVDYNDIDNSFIVKGKLVTGSLSLGGSDVNICGEMVVHGNLIVKTVLTISENGNVLIDGNLGFDFWGGDIINKGVVLCNGHFTPGYGTILDNFGTFMVDGNVLISTSTLGSPLVSINNYGTMGLHDLNMEGNSYYRAQTEDAILYVTGNLNRGHGMGGIVIFDGIGAQTSAAVQFATIILENKSNEGVTFPKKLSVGKLFNHQGNNFTIGNSGANATFPDYDGDGMKDNVDPEPTVGNPCSISFLSEDLEKGAVSVDTIETVGGTEIAVEALPTHKYEFLHWVDASGAVVSTSAKLEVVARGDTTYTAVFQKRSQPITITTDGGIIAAPEKAEIESTVTVSFSENDGYVYKEGSLAYNGTPIVNNTFVMPDEPVTLTASFSRNDHYFALNDMITAAKTYSYDLYTTESFTTLTQAIATAEDALYNHITKEESDEQISLLQQAVDVLVARSVISIDVISMPRFYVNVQGALDNLNLRVTYDNGVTKEISAGQCNVSGLDISILGNQTITLIYEDFEKIVDISVELRELADCAGFEIVDILFDGQTQDYVQSFELSYSLTSDILVEGVDYELTYTNNKEVGEASVAITGMGMYTGTITLMYQIYCEHAYDNACDTDCNICEELRASIEHLYIAVCDSICNECGFAREAAPHDYNNGESFACVTCGMTKESLLSVGNFEDAQLHNLNTGQETTIDENAARTGAFGLHLRGDGGWSGLANHYVDTVVGRKYELSFWVKVNSENGANLQIRDSINGVNIMNKYYGKNCSSWTRVEFSFVATSAQTQIVFSGSGSGEPEDVYLDDICLTAPVLWGGLTSVSEDVNGLAFKFDVSAVGGRVVNNTEYVNNSALVVPGIDGQEYKLVRMGAVVSNKSDAILDLQNVDGKKTINIEAVYLCDLEEDSLSYAVRIINIPENGKDIKIYARPYYVYEKDGEEIVVYGDTVSQSYNAVLGK